MVRVDVAGRDRLDAEVLGEVAEETDPPCVSPLEGALELDVKRSRPNAARDALPRSGRGTRDRAARTREADEPSFGSATASSGTEGGRLAILAPAGACPHALR